MKTNEDIRNIGPAHQSSRFTRYIPLFFKAVWALMICGFLFILLRRGFFTKTGTDSHGIPFALRHIITGVAVSAAGIILFLWKPKNPASRKAVYIISVLSPVIAYFLIEIHMNSHFTYWKPKFTFGNLLLLYTMTLILAAITNHYLSTVLVPIVWWTFFTVMNLFIKSARGTAVVMSDLILIKSAMQVAGEFHFTMSNRTILILIITLEYLLFLFKFKNLRYFDKAAHRAVLSAITAGCIALTYVLILNKSYINLKKTQYLPQRSYSIYGTPLTFISSARILMVEEPDGYSSDALADLQKQYPSDPAESFDVSKAPDILVIMNEAFSDYQDIYGLKTSEDPLPFFNSLKENAIDGHLYVSIHGGQTANSEYEFLTGNSKAFIPGGVSPYQSYMKTPRTHISMARDLKALGYSESVAFHAYNTLGYNRVQAYEDLGFDCFLSEKSVERPQYLRDYISDSSDFNKMISLYEENKARSDKPCFLFNVTMQNHLPFDSYYDNMEYPITILDDRYQDTEYRVYTNLIHETDMAYRDLIEYFEKQDDPVLVIMFGDHQPAISPQKTKGYKLQRYIVPFKIWANYDIPEDHYEYLSPNYMGAMVKNLIGAPLTGYQKFLLDIQKEIPAITYYGYLDKDGNLYDVYDEESPHYETVKKYWMLQYSNLFDEKNANLGFYYMNGDPGDNSGYYVN